MVRRRVCALLFLLPAFCRVCAGQEIRVGVLGIFHPDRLELTAAGSEAVVVNVADQTIVLGPASLQTKANIILTGDHLVVAMDGRKICARGLRSAGRMNDFFLSVPGEISRHYRGALAVSVRNGELTPVVTLDLETAVASVVQAESAPHTPLEALKAQAVVTRSYFVAGKGRHENFDFCDLAHCQVLRGPPAPGSLAARAVEETRGLVLTYKNKAFAAMFTRSCAGRSRTPAELGLPVNGYPYFSVLCDYCHKHPFCWTRRVSPEDAALLLAKGEAGRLAVDRRLGWNAVPSNNFTSRQEENQVILNGQGQGHGIGLCQLGARAMATGGASFHVILRHYFPNSDTVPLG